MSDTAIDKPAEAGANPLPPMGSFVWQELVTPDPGRASAFFGALLGWTFREVDMGENGMYTIATNEGRDLAGMMKMEGPAWDGIPPHWMAYIVVPDVDASAAKVEELGGKVCVPPFDIPTVGRICVINDPTGATVSLLTFAMPGA